MLWQPGVTKSRSSIPHTLTLAGSALPPCMRQHDTCATASCSNMPLHHSAMPASPKATWLHLSAPLAGHVPYKMAPRR
jgi:hypothetical protein